MSKSVDEANPANINQIMSNVKAGFVKARNLTKEDTHKNSKEIMDTAWSKFEELIKLIAQECYNFPPEKKYIFPSNEYLLLWSILAELVKTIQNSFRLAEEGYYRCAFGELRDVLELVMKIKLFYISTEDFKQWSEDPNKVYNTRTMRKLSFFKKSGLNEEIKKLSNSLSLYRHSSSVNLDSRGSVMTNIS
ncbi:hypothetical protein HYW21_07355 [Candidatus Woesearchaeota archaeon]|nr:hypothetical protein [Candidatus Woesearchaeota archaeon]